MSDKPRSPLECERAVETLMLAVYRGDDQHVGTYVRDYENGRIVRHQAVLIVPSPSPQIRLDVRENLRLARAIEKDKFLDAWMFYWVPEGDPLREDWEWVE